MNTTQINRDTGRDTKPSSPAHKARWVRSRDSVIAGVCKGVAKQLNLSPGLVRVAWLLSILFLGTGVLLYLIFAVSLPHEDEPTQGYRPRFMGVCYRIGLRGDMEPGLARLLTVLLFIGSCGWALIAYLALYFILPEAKNE